MTTLSAKQIGKVAYSKGFRGEALVLSIAIALGESSGQVEVVNSIGCVGLWQINQPVHVSAHPSWTRAWLQNAANNAAAASVLSGGGRSWSPWSVYTSGAYKQHLPAARVAAADAASSGSPDGSENNAGNGGKPKGPKNQGGVGSGAGQGAAAAANVPPVLMEPYDPRARLGRIYLHGGKMTKDFEEAVYDASVSWTTTEVSQLQLSVADPGFELFRTGYFEKGTAVLYREPPSPPDPQLELNFRITAVALDGGPAGTGGMTVSARDETVWKLRKRRGAKVMKKCSPTDFVAAECKAIGAKLVGQKSPKRGHVARDVPGKGKEETKGANRPSSWTTFQRLAGELGYLCFAFMGTVYFGKPSWLVAQDKRPLNVALPQDGAPEVYKARTMPTISDSEDAGAPVTISDIEIEKARLVQCHPGGALRLVGLPPYNSYYLLDSLNMPLLGTGGLMLSASTPVDPPKQPPAKPKAKGGGRGGHDESNGTPAGPTTSTTSVTQAGGKSAAAFVSMAISASSAAYVYGAEASTSDATPSALDCSELIQWALGRIGVGFVDGSSAQIAACRGISVAQALATKGALLHKSGHIGISMGNGQSVEARNPSDGVGIFNARDIAWTAGGLVPGLAY